MNEEMEFPDALDEFIKQYSFIDREQIYTNGSELIQTFRIKQWEEHKKQENQSLKKQLEEYKLITIDYQELEARNQELKKRLEEYKYSHSCSFVDTCKNVKIANFNQQKEFIEYLEDYIKEMEEEIGNSMTEPYKKSHIIRRNVYQEILQKYKSIIGVSDEKES